VKRILDIIGALLALIIFSPVMLVVALTIRFLLGAPILFRQRRPGTLGKPFTLLKFRTMREGYGLDGMPLPDAERLTRLGQFLRRTSLDELPELFNVLVGDMSLVGPRPLLLEYLPLYSVEQARRHEVRPGITGWAQVNGRNSLAWDQKFVYDVWYIDHHSLWLDLKILYLSFVRVARAQGISQAGHATSEKFRGSAS
jgi:lipopolysaccharide/colanic/teichoic acid biosynthesis glycosyltransferase